MMGKPRLWLGVRPWISHLFFQVSFFLSQMKSDFCGLSYSKCFMISILQPVVDLGDKLRIVESLELTGIWLEVIVKI